MPRCLHRIVTLLALTLMACVFTTQRPAAQSIFESCGTDLQTFCSDVTPGNGRILSCMYAHEDKLTESCDAAIEDQADLLDWFFETVRHIMDRCADDIRNHCTGVKFGGGRIFSCLVENTTSLTEDCGTLIPELKQLMN